VKGLATSGNARFFAALRMTISVKGYMMHELAGKFIAGMGERNVQEAALFIL